MNITEQKELIDYIDKLIRNSNGWERIDKFFKENKAIQPVLKKIEEECIRNQCYSVATIYVLTIEELLEHLDEYYEERIKIELD